MDTQPKYWNLALNQFATLFEGRPPALPGCGLHRNLDRLYTPALPLPKGTEISALPPRRTPAADETRLPSTENTSMTTGAPSPPYAT